MNQRIRVVHVINNLAAAGAESMLVRLALALREDFDQEVICILDRGSLASRLESEGIPVTALGLSPRAPNPFALFRLAAMLRAKRPDLVQTWLYQSDLLGGLAARAAGVRHVLWNLRGAYRTLDGPHPLTRVIVAACGRLSRSVPERIVCCARSIVDEHVGLGYDRARMVLIPNGIDTDRFGPDAEARRSVREELGVSPRTPLIGLIGRWHPQKDHATFAAAAARLREGDRTARFVLAGSGVARGNAALDELLARHGLVDGVHLLGERDDVPRLTAALDVATSTSWGEGFPNVLAEAMACGVPCVATDVGDAGEIVGETGRIVPRGDPEAVARAWSSLLALAPGERAELGRQARDRIEERFGLRRSVDAYRALYIALAAGRR